MLRRVLLATAPSAVGAAVALALWVATPPAPARDARVRIGPARSAGTTSEDCAPCHTREVAQWRASAMAFAARSPLVGALESLVEEQVGRDETCPNGAGVLRAKGVDACVDGRSGIASTGAGGENWCVNCHVPGENLRRAMPGWSAHGSSRGRAPLRDLLPAPSLEGVSCAACHSTVGPVARHASRSRAYEGNATWTSSATGASFLTRPEDASGRPGIGNSGYRLDVRLLVGDDRAPYAPVAGGSGTPDRGMGHPAPGEQTTQYLESSEFCGACHDVRLFGTDVRGVQQRGEHFKRLRNAYSEWRAWADGEARAGRRPATCQDCHMSLYPGTCAAGGEGDGGCPPGTHFVSRDRGAFPTGRVASSSRDPVRVMSHWFTGVELPLAEGLPESLIDDTTLDADGVPVGLEARRQILLRHTFRFDIGDAQRRAGGLQVPIEIENVGAGHRVPAGFSQERETWVELRVLDGVGRVVYEAGRVARPDEDLPDKRLDRVTTTDVQVDASGRPRGLFGSDVVDGPDAPHWTPDPRLGGTRFVGRGLVNLQNGFQRCVRCIGAIDATGQCIAGDRQGVTRADRFADGAYDADTGECLSNLSGEAALFETYFPVGALDADRGVVKAPDAILDTRSAPPGVALRYTYLLETGTHPPPFEILARLLFRPFPPYLVRAFASYERARAREGLRPSGPQVTEAMLRRDAPIELARAIARVP